MSGSVPRCFEIPYSTKNIPVMSKMLFQKMLTTRIIDLVTRMRWKLFWSKNDKPPEGSKTFGFKSTAKAPPDPSLKEFEHELFDMIRSLETRAVHDELQDRMKKDLEFINSLENEVIVAADKTSNFYIMKVEEYKKHLHKEVTKCYKKVDHAVVENIDEDSAQFARSLKLDDRVEGTAEKPAFLHIKDHKDDFPQKLSFRLINPTNNNLGRISKCILDSANMIVRQQSMLNQWRSTKEAIDWFCGLEGKGSTLWLKFDIESFYPSITEELLLKSL